MAGREKTGGRSASRRRGAHGSEVRLLGTGRAVLERRRDTTVAILASTRDLNGLSVRLCPAADLFARGPYPPIFTGVGGSETPVEWRVFDRENG